jgi:hypothetical protein
VAADTRPLFLTRKRVAWRAYLDTPINLAPAQLRYMGKRLTYMPCTDQHQDLMSTLCAPGAR